MTAFRLNVLGVDYDVTLDGGTVIAEYDDMQHAKQSSRPGRYKTARPDNSERNAAILAEINRGATFGDAGKRCGVSRELVAGVVWRHKRRLKRGQKRCTEQSRKPKRQSGRPATPATNSATSG